MSDPYELATEGWRILTRHRESRESARFLLRWLAGSLNVEFIGIRYIDEKTGYGWEESVLRRSAAMGGEPGRRKTRAFPSGSSYWLIDDHGKTEREHGALLDLLAAQWLHFSCSPGEEKRPAAFADDLDRLDPVDGAWVAVSRRSRILLNRLPRISQSKNPLLLIGETGSGRSRLAILIHRNGSDPSAPFLEGVDADEGVPGTLFLPNWGTIPREDRRILLSGEARIIASVPGGDGEDGVRKEWAALTHNTGMILPVPSLRERKEDIPLLAGEFLKRGAAVAGRNVPSLSPSALDVLRAYPWPGNARELKEAMIRSLSEAGEEITPNDLPAAIRGVRSKASEQPFPEKLVALEYQAIKEELSRQRGNMTRTAHALGLTPRQVSWRVRKYGIDPRDFKPRRRNAAKA